MSLPVVLGLSMMMFNPVFIPEPTSMGAFPVIFLTAVMRVLFKGGTTEEMMDPSMAEGEMPWISRIFFMAMAYSRFVLFRSVVTRSSK